MKANTYFVLVPRLPRSNQLTTKKSMVPRRILFVGGSTEKACTERALPGAVSYSGSWHCCHLRCDQKCEPGPVTWHIAVATFRLPSGTIVA